MTEAMLHRFSNIPKHLLILNKNILNHYLFSSFINGNFEVFKRSLEYGVEIEESGVLKYMCIYNKNEYVELIDKYLKKNK